MKICVLAGRYAISGVPLAQLRFARALAAQGHQVDFIIGHVNEGYLAPSIAGVQVLVMEKTRVAGMLAPMVAYYKEAKPDLVFSAGDHLNAIVLLAAILARSKAKISCSSRVTPFDTYSNTVFTKRWVLKQAMRVLMPRADALTCVSKDMVTQYREIFKAARHVCVYNIVQDDDSQSKMMEPVDEPWLINKNESVIVAAGSLVPWKGFADLILAMKEVVKTHKAKLLILGDGASRLELQTLIQKNNLDDSIKLLGYVENPLKYFYQADIFVLSSYVEGMPNVLVEAMMCGCTPVATDCPTGPRELLQDGKYGYLVPVADPVAMAKGIQKAIDQPIAKSLLHEAVFPFTTQEVITKHFHLLNVPINHPTHG
jgi:glycosyltransferase involved in cell wall biosynthesis